MAQIHNARDEEEKKKAEEERSRRSKLSFIQITYTRLMIKKSKAYGNC